ncbi:4-aminobutyrate aminotransferase [Kribbella sp. VKM Ac-2527]|uniref:4-aminobutyrate aminotransferase n=1 Tax=Kribbella caucasensis TaxID=2512215 RepID=A0A4R6KJ29_9ACTN|nr:aspartate aminotransferase family protein [Kribbella sp. VKM Ac-2527]TDO51278.1 4-aminobutyrate aminotransferase [Kribbella sp. VKM Ac-2527]
MALTWYERDQASLVAAQKLRFFPLEVVAGEGRFLIEPGGRRLLDLSASWSASGLGHGHPAVAEAVATVLRSAPGAGAISAAHPEAVQLAEELLAIVPGADDRRVYLGHAGSDANDVALRACRHATGRRRIVSFEHSYHGGLGLAQGISGVQVDAGADASADAVFLPYPDPLRPHLGTVEEAVADVLRSAEQALSAGDVAAVIVEPILSDGGLVVPATGFLAELARLCREHETPLICDEVKVGLARTGLLHCFEHEGIQPDIVTFGKSLGGGLPLSAAVGPTSLLDQPAGSALLTTAGNPVSAAAGRAVLHAIKSEGLVENAAAMGQRLADGLRGALDVADRCADIRGRGLALGIDLVTGDGLERDADLTRKAVYRAWQLGAVAFYVGGNVIELTPPLTITATEIDLAVTILVQAITDAVNGVVSADEVDAFAGW